MCHGQAPDQVVMTSNPTGTGCVYQQDTFTRVWSIPRKLLHLDKTEKLLIFIPSYNAPVICNMAPPPMQKDEDCDFSVFNALL